jgi:hypothetical protein
LTAPPHVVTSAAESGVSAPGRFDGPTTAARESGPLAHARDDGAWWALRPAFRPARDALLAAVALAVALFVGSAGFANLDPALVGYLGGTAIAFVASVYRVSAFWRRPASAFYARALGEALRRPRSLRATIGHARRDLATQRFLRKRSVVRWLAHLALSLGTLASFAITVPLVFGWMHFVADGDRYRVIFFTVPTLSFAVGGPIGWAFFHALSIAGVAVLLGALFFLVVRIRDRRLPGATSSFAIAPLLLLLFVAATGLALPASRGHPEVFAVAAWLHQAAVVVLLVAIPFSKLGHVLIRPLQLGARAVRATEAPRARCGCGAPLAPVAQTEAVTRLLEARGLRLAADRCPACRRRQLAATQARLVDACFQPGLAAARAARPTGAERS